MHRSQVCPPGIQIGHRALVFHTKRAKLAAFWHTGSHHVREGASRCPRFFVVKRPSTLSTYPTMNASGFIPCSIKAQGLRVRSPARGFYWRLIAMIPMRPSPMRCMSIAPPSLPCASAVSSTDSRRPSLMPCARARRANSMAPRKPSPSHWLARRPPKGKHAGRCNCWPISSSAWASSRRFLTSVCAKR